ncbi:MAG: PilZ domain-containing protein [Candidatus Zixiibacteriota bacterium]
MDRRKSQRRAPDEYITVYDEVTGQPIGSLANMSIDGVKLVTDQAIKPGTILECRINLETDIMGYKEIYFSAECRWCRKNVAAGHWESGFLLQASGIDMNLISYMILGFKLCNWGDESVPDVETAEMENRRRSVRYEFENPLPIYEFRGYRQLGILADISIDGARICTIKPITKGRTIKFRLKLPREVFRQDFIVLEAKCMWCRKNKNDDYFQSGHALLNVSKENSSVILHLIIHFATPQYTKPKIVVVE